MFSKFCFEFEIAFLNFKFQENETIPLSYFHFPLTVSILGPTHYLTVGTDGFLIIRDASGIDVFVQ